MYTNHSVCVTGVTILTQDKKKVKMGSVMHGSMIMSEVEIQRQIIWKSVPALLYQQLNISAITPVVEEKENAAKELIPFEANFNNEQDVPDFDLMAWILEFTQSYLFYIFLKNWCLLDRFKTIYRNI